MGVLVFTICVNTGSEPHKCLMHSAILMFFIAFPKSLIFLAWVRTTSFNLVHSSQGRFRFRLSIGGLVMLIVVTSSLTGVVWVNGGPGSSASAIRSKTGQPLFSKDSGTLRLKTGITQVVSQTGAVTANAICNIFSLPYSAGGGNSDQNFIRLSFAKVGAQFELNSVSK